MLRSVPRIGLVLVLALSALGPWTFVGAGSPVAPVTGSIDPADGDSTSADRQTNDTAVEIEASLPNPVADGDKGEYVTISVPRSTNFSGWSLADQQGTTPLPNRTVSGRVRLATNPDAVPGDETVLELRGRIALSNSGERIELRRNGRVVDSLSYDDAPEGELYLRDGEIWRWRPLGATDRAVNGVNDVPVKSFVLPDSPDAALAPLRNATDRLLIAGYTITSGRVVRALCAAHDRGVRVRALFEGGPVGGISKQGGDRLDRLTACGVPVSVIGGDHARYAFHHAKYAVVDDAAVVLTENWKPGGTGGRSNRGWGTYVDDQQVADELAETFHADAGFRDAIPWERYRRNASLVGSDPAPSSQYPGRFQPRAVNATRVSVLVAPDNAESTIVSEIDTAEESIRVEQISIGSRHHPFVQALLRAARRGVTVRVLLGSASYVRGDNREIATYLNKLADDDDLPLEAKIVAPRSRFGKIHAKGIVIDDTTILGSINWTNGSIRANREVALLIEDPAVARYYERVLRADWRGGVWSVSAGVLAILVLTLGGAALVGAKMRFDRGYSVSPGAADP